ncbi:MAG: hypothetical protein ABEJ35_07820 [Halobacteriaceae archaeon]
MVLLSTATRSGVRMETFLPALGIWLVMAVLAVLNAILREMVLIPAWGSSAGHLLSTLLFVLIVLFAAWGYFSSSPFTHDPEETFLIGIVWTIATVGLEYVIGAIDWGAVPGRIARYNLFAGDYWLAVPLALLFGPVLMGWLWE